MAKTLVRDYTFTPGAGGVGTVVFSGVYTLEEILLVTNVTDNQIIYNFASSGKGGSVTSDDDETTLTFSFDTSSMDAADELQIFIEDEYQETDFNEAYVDLQTNSGYLIHLTSLTLTLNTDCNHLSGKHWKW